jgi:ABC-type dipeptide/oligopeptide/nickel transport system ATPase component
VSHDLSVVKHLAHHVAVMYAGSIVEQGDSEQLFADPQHEYTRRLLCAEPQPDPGKYARPATMQAAQGVPPAATRGGGRREEGPGNVV